MVRKYIDYSSYLYQ